MLTRKCSQEVVKLLSENDFNVRVTIVPTMSRFTQRSYGDAAWCETFRDAIGGGIVNDPTTYYHVEFISVDTDYEFITTGNQILAKCKKDLILANAVRINITKMPVDLNNRRTWIIARN